MESTGFTDYCLMTEGMEEGSCAAATSVLNVAAAAATNDDSCYCAHAWGATSCAASDMEFDYAVVGIQDEDVREAPFHHLCRNGSSVNYDSADYCDMSLGILRTQAMGTLVGTLVGRVVYTYRGEVAHNKRCPPPPYNAPAPTLSLTFPPPPPPPTHSPRPQEEIGTVTPWPRAMLALASGSVCL